MSSAVTGKSAAKALCASVRTSILGDNGLVLTKERKCGKSGTAGQVGLLNSNRASMAHGSFEASEENAPPVSLNGSCAVVAMVTEGASAGQTTGASR